MALYQFPYVTFDLPNAANRVYRPVLKLQVVNGNLRQQCFGIVDTGADFCAFPSAFAHALGLDTLHETPLPTLGVGGGGPALTYYFNVVLEVPPVGAFSVRAGFLDSLNALGRGLLGHSGFLDRLMVSFDGRKRVFSIET